MSTPIQIHHDRCHRWLLTVAILALVLISNAQGQTTQFTYQGRLTDAGNPANSSYDMQFKLFDSADFVTGNQVGSTINKSAVQVSNGGFAVELDFGASAFSGAARFLEIGIRPAGSPNPFTVLGPRHAVTATPYAVRSVSAAAADTAANAANATNATNAAQLGGITAGQYVVTTDARLTDARPPTAGSNSYVQNGTSQQDSTNFNISGDGTAAGMLSGSVVNAATQYKLAGMRMLVVSGPISSGIPLAASNTFLGENAGLNTMPDPMPNVVNGKFNSFFGANAGRANTNLGTSNSFFGTRAGEANTDGVANSFFGTFAGRTNTTGQDNAFFGSSAGTSNTTGEANSFFGASTASTNTTGRNNTIIGSFANVNASNLTNATAIGHRALVTVSNSLVLGSVNGANGATASTNVAIGTVTPFDRLHITTNGGGQILFGNSGCPQLGFASIGFSLFNTNCTQYALGGDVDNTYINRRMGGTIIFRENNGPNQVEIRPGGFVGIGALDGGGSIPLCRNGIVAIATCSSSLRYKRDVQPFFRGLDLIKRLQPITFTWKQDGKRDVGFGAEDVAAIEPLLITHNEKGEIEGVKYDRITVALVNAVREQQAQIAKQKQQIDALKRLVCIDHPKASICNSN